MPASRTLLLGDREITRVGLGTNRLTDTDANHVFLREAVAAGLDFIDTAHLYTGGKSERAVGDALGSSDGVVVATKGGYDGGGPERLREEIEQSLRSLQTERIELYYLHRVDPRVEIEETMSVLKEYVDGGSIAHVGLSEVEIDQIERARSVASVAAVQNEYSLGERKHEEVIDHCEAEGIAFVPFFPLRGEPRALAEVAERRGATPNQVKIAWLLARSPVVAPIPGTLSIQHLRENLAALDLELSPEEIEDLAAG